MASWPLRSRSLERAWVRIDIADEFAALVTRWRGHPEGRVRAMATRLGVAGRSGREGTDRAHG